MMALKAAKTHNRGVRLVLGFRIPVRRRGRVLYHMFDGYPTQLSDRKVL